ncbi:MAG TPA: cyanophycinase [Terriglobales bacterium]|nr:cyanophycinase [Terriglobales bacterium]
MLGKVLRVFWVALILTSFGGASPAASYKYIRIGQKNDAQTRPVAGIAMMGGGTDLDEAFRWLCGKADGGDFLILRAHGDDDYNSYVNGLCKLNSVATLIIPDRDAANDPAVADIIRHAEVIFIAGGDQANYIHFWRGSPVQEAINQHIAGGKPIGGTSAGLAVQGEFAYGALNDPGDSELHSNEALPNPYHNQVTVVRDFLKIPRLENTITDSHFAKRDRMGRTLVFLARIMQDGWSREPREVAIDEKSAVLVGADGKSVVIGSGRGAYFLRPTRAPDICRKDVPLSFRHVSVYRAPSGAHFDLASWTGTGGVSYSLSVDQGIIHSTQPDAAVY